VVAPVVVMIAGGPFLLDVRDLAVGCDLAVVAGHAPAREICKAEKTNKAHHPENPVGLLRLLRPAAPYAPRSCVPLSNSCTLPRDRMLRTSGRRITVFDAGNSREFPCGDPKRVPRPPPRVDTQDRVKLREFRASLEFTPPMLWINRGGDRVSRWRRRATVDRVGAAQGDGDWRPGPRTSPAAETINLPIVNLLSSEVENL
jgi:hypothetical protein